MMADPPTQRILELRARLVSAIPGICPERAIILTHAFRENENKSASERWTLALDEILHQMTIYINQDELIVGNQASSPMYAPLFPEASVSWLLTDLEKLESRAQDPFRVSAEARREIERITSYWQDRSMEHLYGSVCPQDIADSEAAKAIRIKSAGGIGHHLINLDFVLENGILGINDLIRKQIDLNRSEGNDPNKLAFWKALQKTCSSYIAFAQRYSELANAQAALTTNIQRKKELKQIASVCARIPAHPAKTFHEALQCTWFLTVIAHIFQSGGGVTIGRLDHILNPYLEQDLERERLTISEAQELLDCFWLKLQELNVVRSSEVVTAWAGYEVNPTVNIGGQGRPGVDATNQLTFMCLQAEEHVHMRNPQLIMRVHEGTPDELWRSAVRVMRLGGGKPSLISDKVCMSALRRLGVPGERLHRYSVIGCAEPTEGDSRIMVRWAWLCLPKILELSLHDGVDPRSGMRVGLSTGPAQNFKHIDDLLEAFDLQLNHQVGLIRTAINDYADPLVSTQMPHFAFSVLTPSCIEKGHDISDGGSDRTWSVIWPIGPATTINAIAAIDNVIYKNRHAKWPELLHALNTDFIDAESLRQRLLRAPKFGNDNAKVDALAQRFISMIYDAVEQHRNIFNGPYTTGFITLGANVHYGKFVGATPDGRKSGTPLSDGMSPSQGTELEGPTATLKSVAKLDLHRAGSGGILNLKFNPSILENPSDITKFIQLNETFLLDLDGLQVQYNIVSADTLRQAQLNPDKFPDLLVRVVGYCARFIDLSPEVQEDLIARTEHGSGRGIRSGI